MAKKESPATLAEAEAAHALLIAASKAALETFAQAQAVEAESLAALEELRAAQE